MDKKYKKQLKKEIRKLSKRGKKELLTELNDTYNKISRLYYSDANLTKENEKIYQKTFEEIAEIDYMVRCRLKR